jgi:hypothetical protein
MACLVLYVHFNVKEMQKTEKSAKHTAGAKTSV